MSDDSKLTDTLYDTDETVIDDGTSSDIQTVKDDETVPDGDVTREEAVCAIEKGASLLDTYRVESDAIKGGMGAVWRVHHAGWNVALAMKQPQTAYFVTEKNKTDFIRECEAWIGLGLHPHIVSCYYVREIGGVPAIFSEWMDGGSLADAIENGELYAGSEADRQQRLLDIAIQFARGLHYAHECRDENGEPKGLIHQDVKPGNLLLTKDGDAKVADFGIAKARATLTVMDISAEAPAAYAKPSETMFSVSGAYTPAYCSMEQMNGLKLTRRTDIYSWAVSVMEMYLGDRPWINGVIAGAACESYFEQARVPLPEGMPELLRQCLSEEESRRPHDFTAVEEVLLRIYETVTGGDYPRPASEAAADTADSLNNKALSFLDIGKLQEAARCWERALKLEPLHPAAQYNRLIRLWRDGQIDDRTLQENFETVCAGNPQHAELCGRLKNMLAREARADSDLQMCIRETGLKKADYVEAGAGGRFVAAGGNLAVLGSADGDEPHALNLDKLAPCCIRLFFHNEELCLLTENELIYYDTQTNTIVKRLPVTLPKEYLVNSPRELVYRYFAHFTGGDLIAASANYFDDYMNEDYGNEITFLLNTNTGEIARIYKSSSEPTAVGSSTDGGYVVTAYRYGLFECRGTNEQWHSGMANDRHKANVTSIRFFPSSAQFLTCSTDRSIKHWDAGKKKCIKSFSGHNEDVTDISILPGGGYFASVDKTEMKIWELKSGKCLHTLALPGEAVSICAGQAGNILIGLNDGRLIICEFPDFSYKSPFELCRIKPFKQSWSEQAALTQAVNEIKRLISSKDIGGALDALNKTENRFGIRSQSTLEGLRMEAGRYCRRRRLKYHRLIAQYSLHSTRFLECYPEAVALSDDDTCFIYNGSYTAAALVKADVKTGEVKYVINNFRGYMALLYSPDAQYAAKPTPFSKDDVDIQIRSTDNENDYQSFRYNPQEIAGTAHFSVDNRFLVICDTKRKKTPLSDMIIWDVKKRAAAVTGGDFCTVLAEDGRCFELRIRNQSATIKELNLPAADTADIGSLAVADNALFRCVGRDGTLLLTVDAHDAVRVHRLVWEYTFPGFSEWNEGARQYLDIFLILHPDWTETDFSALLTELQNRGYGWLRPEGVRKKLMKMRSKG